MPDFDYVIVGAGSAGCVLANRLSADPSVSVALVEAGDRDTSPFIHMPRGVAKLVLNRLHMWIYQTEPEGKTVTKPDVWLRGKTLGGSSSVNGMVWVRGQPADYDQMAAASSDDWSWKHIGRAFEEIENHELGPAPSRGGAGPQRISVATFRNKLSEAINKAGERMGWPIKEDINDPDVGDGIGYIPRSIWRGRRQSAAVSFLRPIKGRPNLTIITGALTDKVLFDGKRATGIRFLKDGRGQEIRARREVILCGGAVASPSILERSGIGDPAVLGKFGIPVVHANPAVGEGMSEHRGIRIQWRLKQPLSMNPDFAGWRLGVSVIRYYLTHDGPLSGAAMDLRAAFRSRPDVDRPDIQTQFGLYSWNLSGVGSNKLEYEHGFCAVAYPLRPESRGSIHIRSADPKDPPLIVANYCEDEEDRKVTIASARLLRQMAEQEPLRDLIAFEVAPGPEVQSDEDLIVYNEKLGVAGLHTVGSCRMGKDAGSVVDPELRVRGVEGLRVMDASVMPVIPAGNTNAPTLAMAWRASEIIKRSWSNAA